MWRQPAYMYLFISILILITCNLPSCFALLYRVWSVIQSTGLVWTCCVLYCMLLETITVSMFNNTLKICYITILYSIYKQSLEELKGPSISNFLCSSSTCNFLNLFHFHGVKWHKLLYRALNLSQWIVSYPFIPQFFGTCSNNDTELETSAVRLFAISRFLCQIGNFSFSFAW